VYLLICQFKSLEIKIKIHIFAHFKSLMSLYTKNKALLFHNYIYLMPTIQKHVILKANTFQMYCHFDF